MGFRGSSLDFRIFFVFLILETRGLSAMQFGYVLGGKSVECKYVTGLSHKASYAIQVFRLGLEFHLNVSVISECFNNLSVLL